MEYLQITDEQFWAVVDKFRTPHIWKKENGAWKLNKAVYDEYPSLQNDSPGYITTLAASKGV